MGRGQEVGEESGIAEDKTQRQRQGDRTTPEEQ